MVQLAEQVQLETVQLAEQETAKQTRNCLKQFKVQGTTYKVQMLHRLSADNEKLNATAKQLNAYIISG